ncbi:DUF3784 domain-containing protein [Lentibacillus sp. L22]|uniref:DUF3784 domain-containing protein n=1 Tax=Lentibacillus TaxID=175304 RepID=UPI00346731B7
MDSLIGIIIGACFVWIGYVVRSKKTFFFFAGFWEPVNREKLARRIGVLFIVTGIIAIITSFLVIWFSSIGAVSGILVFILIIMILISIILDQVGY